MHCSGDFWGGSAAIMHRVGQYSIYTGYEYGGFALSYAVCTGYLYGFGQPYDAHDSCTLWSAHTLWCMLLGRSSFHNMIPSFWGGLHIFTNQCDKVEVANFVLQLSCSCNAPMQLLHTLLAVTKISTRWMYTLLKMVSLVFACYLLLPHPFVRP